MLSFSLAIQFSLILSRTFYLYHSASLFLISLIEREPISFNFSLFIRFLIERTFLSFNISLFIRFLIERTLLSFNISLFTKFLIERKPISFNISLFTKFLIERKHLSFNISLFIGFLIERTPISFNFVFATYICFTQLCSVKSHLSPSVSSIVTEQFLSDFSTSVCGNNVRSSCFKKAP